MYTQKNDTYAIAYVEILEIIKNMEQKYQEKIPTKLIKFFEEKKDKNYNFKLDNDTKVEEKSTVFSQKTIDLLAMLQLKYLASKKEKTELAIALEENDKKLQTELREKYNPNNLFKNRNEKTVELANNKIQEYKEKNFIQKIFDRIIRLFKRK